MPDPHPQDDEVGGGQSEPMEDSVTEGDATSEDLHYRFLRVGGSVVESETDA